LTAVLFRCLTGSAPFRGVPLAVLRAHEEQAPPRVTEARPELPTAIDGVIARGMAKDPAKRPASAGRLIDLADAALSGSTVTSVHPRPQARPRRRPLLAAALALAVVAALLVVVAPWRGDGTADPPA